GDQPFVPAQFPREVQRSRFGRRRGHDWFSVVKVIGVLPDGDLYHLEYLVRHMVSNDPAQQPAHAEGALNSEKPSFAWPVCCSAWFGPKDLVSLLFALTENLLDGDRRLLVQPTQFSLRDKALCGLGAKPLGVIGNPELPMSCSSQFQ